VKFGKVIDNIVDVLDKRRFLAVVIGDKYSDGEWIPLAPPESVRNVTAVVRYAAM